MKYIKNAKQLEFTMAEQSAKITGIPIFNL